MSLCVSLGIASVFGSNNSSSTRGSDCMNFRRVPSCCSSYRHVSCTSLPFPFLAFYCCRQNESPWWPGFVSGAEQEAVEVKSLVFAAVKDSHLLLEGGPPACFPEHTEFGKVRLCGAFRGFRCAALATKLNSLFQVFPKYQDICSTHFFL